MAQRIALLLAILWGSSAAARPLTIEFIDVGQGDATLITSPTGKTVLVDAGPPDHVAHLLGRLARLTGPLDLVLLTHQHLDHLGGMLQVIAKHGARLFLDPELEHASPHYQQLLALLQQRNIMVKNAQAGRRIDLGGGVVLTLLTPPTPRLPGKLNANSVAARIVSGQVAVILAADIEAKTERWLMAQHTPLDAQVIKVAHHGSPHSSSAPWVRTVSPSLAIISVAADNDYGHPAASTLKRWQASGAKILRTDQDGDITVSIEGNEVRWSTSKHASPTLLPRRTTSAEAQP